MTEQTAKRYALDPVKSRVLAEAERAQIATQNYINQLTIRAEGLDKQIAALNEEMLKLKGTADELRADALKAKEAADGAFKTSLTEMVGTFGVQPPWKATIVYSEGVAVALDVEVEAAPAEPGQDLEIDAE